MIKLGNLPLHKEVHHETLPIDHPMMIGRCINTPIYVQDDQWRLKIQSFTKGGFEAKAVLVNRNAMSRMINENRYRGKRTKPKEKDEAKKRRDIEKCAYRAARRVRQLCIEIRADRLLTLTSRELLTDYDQVATAWKKFLRVLEGAGVTFEYVTVPELHTNGQHYHIHAAINGYVKADMLRRCWQIALGGKGCEKGKDALGNVDIKRSIRKSHNANKHTMAIAKYISKYITKTYLEHHQFNRKRYWAPRSIKLPETQAEWMQAETLADVLQEFHSRFDSAIMMEANKSGIFITEANAPMVFFRYLPDEENPISAPF